MRDNAAVSPVIGVLLLVAITVVLSTTVFYVAGRFQDGPEPGPRVLMETDQGTHEARVVRGDANLDWTDLEVSGSCIPTLNGAPFPTAPGQAVRAGDVLGCAAGEDLEVSSGLDDGNALLYTVSFR